MILLNTAQEYHAAGLSVLPARRQEKRPAIPSWKEFQKQLPSASHIAAWFANEQDALCVICGQVSGNLEVLDFDHHGELYDAWRASIPQELCDRLVIEQTPSGGSHVAYRCKEGIAGNLKLAVGLRDGKRMTLIETRGEGGLVLCAPTEGYQLMQGDYTHLGVLSSNERITLLDAAWRLNEHTEENRFEKQAREDTHFTTRPGDDYNARGDFQALLEAHEWVYLRTMPDGNEHWRRPGKEGEQTSATLKDGSFYVFSSNAEPFESGRCYTAFNAYALLEHGGDYTKAASELSRQGYGQAAEEYAGVDLSGILGQVAASGDNPTEDNASPENGDSQDVQDEIAETFSDPGKIQEKLLHIPGFVDELTDWSMDSAPYPNRVLSFCGALAFLAYLVGRKTTDERNNRANIYLIALANSGVGKDHPRKVNMSLAINSYLGSGIADAFASGEGLEDALYLTPSMLFQVDEFDTLINSLKFSKDTKSESIIEKMLRIYSSSSSMFKLRKRAMSRSELVKQREQTNQVSNENGDFITNPNLVIFGTAIPQMFYEALSTRLLVNGLTARCLILNAGKRSHPQKAKVINPTDSIRRAIEVFKSYGASGNLTAENPAPMVIPAATQADAALEALSKTYDQLYSKYEKVQAQIPMAFWARAHEKVCKLSMLYAISANPTNPVINEEAVRWAQKFVDFLTDQALFQVHAYSYENPFDEKCQKALRYIRNAGGEYNHSKLLKRMHEAKDVFEKIISTLIENGSVVTTYKQANTRISKTYRLA